MEFEEILKKHIQEDLKKSKTDEYFVANVMNKINAYESKKVQPLITKKAWLGIFCITGFIISFSILIETSFTILIDLPSISKKLGVFLSEMLLPVIGLVVAILFVIADRLLRKRGFTS